MFRKDVFASVQDMAAEEARRYAAEHEAGSFTILDVRTPEEYRRDHIPGAVLIPVSELVDRLNELDRGKPVIAY